MTMMKLRKLDAVTWLVVAATLILAASAAPRSQGNLSRFGRSPEEDSDVPPPPKWDVAPAGDQEEPVDHEESTPPHSAQANQLLHQDSSSDTQMTSDKSPPPPKWDKPPDEEGEDPNEILIVESVGVKQQSAPLEGAGTHSAVLNTGRADGGSGSILPGVPNVPGIPGGSQSGNSSSGFPSVPGLEGVSGMAGDGRTPTLILGGFSVLVMPMPAGGQWASAMQGLIPGMSQMPGMPGAGAGGAPAMPGMPAVPSG